MSTNTRTLTDSQLIDASIRAERAVDKDRLAATDDELLARLSTQGDAVMNDYTDNTWVEELLYIDAITHAHGKVKASETAHQHFISYCKNQRDRAREEGFEEVAAHIQGCIDRLTTNAQEH